VAKRDVTNPYGGGKGFWNRWNAFTYVFSGAAQVGIGRGKAEKPYAKPADAGCPMCGKPIAAHRIERSTDQRHSTRIHCPTD